MPNGWTLGGFHILVLCRLCFLLRNRSKTNLEPRLHWRLKRCELGEMNCTQRFLTMHRAPWFRQAEDSAEHWSKNTVLSKTEICWMLRKKDFEFPFCLPCYKGLEFCLSWSVRRHETHNSATIHESRKNSLREEKRCS